MRHLVSPLSSGFLATQEIYSELRLMGIADTNGIGLHANTFSSRVFLDYDETYLVEKLQIPHKQLYFLDFPCGPYLPLKINLSIPHNRPWHLRQGKGTVIPTALGLVLY